MSKDVLMIATVEGVEETAGMIASQNGARVEVAKHRRAGLQALRRQQWAVVVVEESLAEGDPDWADLVWELAGLAIPVQVSFARSGMARLAREVRAAQNRRDGEQAIARRVVATEMENELKSSVTGLLLESQLALSEAAVPPPLEAKLRHLVELAAMLRERLRSATAAAAA